MSPPHPIGPLEDRHLMARLVELGGRREAGRTGADHRDLAAGAALGQIRHHPPFLPAPINYFAFDVLDGDRQAVHATGARALAGCRTHPPRELGKVIGLVQAFESLAPVVAVNEVVPLGDKIINGTTAGHAADQLAGMAVGDAAIHAAGGLVPQLLDLGMEVKLVPVFDALQSGPVQRQLARKIHESSRFAHRMC